MRSAALYAIDNLRADTQFSEGLQEFVPTIRRIAQSDPFEVEPGKGNYPLRFRARELLQKLGTH